MPARWATTWKYSTTKLNNMKPIERHLRTYNRCVDEAISYLNQAICWIKENSEKGYYPDTFYSLHKMKYYLWNERIIEKEGD